MRTYVLLELEPADASGDLVAHLRQSLPATRDTEGCESIAVHQQVGDPGTILVLQRWASREAYERYALHRRERGDVAELTSLLGAPPRARYFEEWRWTAPTD